jgi:hypothetical protein
VTGCVELADDVGADETGRTGDENGERFGIHAPVLGGNLHHRPAISAIFAWFSGPVASGCAHGTENQHRQHRVDNTCARARARIMRVLTRELIHCCPNQNAPHNFRDPADSLSFYDRCLGTAVSDRQD